MIRMLLLTACAVAPIASLAGCRGPLQRDVAIDHEALARTLPSARGGDSTIRDEVGDRFAVVQYGATWCGLCRGWYPVLRELDETHGDRIAVVGVWLDENPEVVRTYAVRHDLGWRHLVATRGFRDPVAWDLGISGVPTVYAFFPEGHGVEITGDRLDDLALESVGIPTTWGFNERGFDAEQDFLDAYGEPDEREHWRGGVTLWRYSRTDERTGMSVITEFTMRDGKRDDYQRSTFTPSGG